MKPTTLTLPGLMLLALVVCGCATVPGPLEGEFSALTPEQSEDRHVGQTVRWGGSIVDTRPGETETCIEILGRHLDDRARPITDDDERGRFLACRDGFEDPQIFKGGRAITVIGTLQGFVEGQIGEFSYVYPRVDAETLFLWDEERPARYYDSRFYYDPWWPYSSFPWSHPRWHFSGHIIIGD